MLNRFLPLCLTLLSLLVGLPGQGERKPDARPHLGPRSFFPKEYTMEAFLNADALQDTTLWDAMERSPLLGPLRMKFRQEFGYRLDDIKRIRVAGRYITAAENSPGGEREVSVIVVEGKVSLPPVRAPEQFASHEKKRAKVAGHDVVIAVPTGVFGGSTEAQISVMPTPGCLVTGSEEMIRSVLEGKRRGGVIQSRLMALTALRDPLGYFAVGFPPPGDPRYNKDIPFDPNWLSEADPLEHLLALMTYVEKTEEVRLTATLRFKNGKAGPVLLQESAKAAIEVWKTNKAYFLVKTYFDKITWQVDGVDLHVSISVKPSDMTGLFGVGGLASLFFMSASAIRVAPAAPMPLAPAPVVPAARAKQGGKKPAEKPAKKVKAKKVPGS